MSKKKLILDTISDLVSDLTYYDRKEDEDLSESDLDECIGLGEITIDDMVNHFRKELEEVYN